MTALTETAIVHTLLEKEPWVEVTNGPHPVGAHACRSVVQLWQELERLTGRREEPPYWAVIWPGATLLATVLINNPELVRARRVVDVGCGSGVCGIAAAKAGAATVIANDVDLYALQAARFNASKNGVNTETIALDLTRSDPREWDATDTLLLSEMFYNAAAAERMWSWLRSVRKRGATILLADGERPFFRADELEKLATTILPVNFELEGVLQRTVSVYAMQPERRVRGH